MRGGTELGERQAVFDVEYRLARPGELVKPVTSVLRGSALVVLEALLVYGEVEVPQQVRDLRLVVLERRRQAGLTCQVGQERVIAKLVVRGQREAGVVGIPID